MTYNNTELTVKEAEKLAYISGDVVAAELSAKTDDLEVKSWQQGLVRYSVPCRVYQ